MGHASIGHLCTVQENNLQALDFRQVRHRLVADRGSVEVEIGHVFQVNQGSQVTILDILFHELDGHGMSSLDGRPQVFYGLASLKLGRIRLRGFIAPGGNDEQDQQGDGSSH